MGEAALLKDAPLCPVEENLSSSRLNFEKSRQRKPKILTTELAD